MQNKKIQDIGKFVIETEASALSKLASDLPADFSATIGAVLKTKGRVVVSGVGKSWHVGRKIAALWPVQEHQRASCTRQKQVMVI